MNPDLDCAYLDYLVSLIEPDDVDHDYSKLYMHLYRARFVHFFPGDENRASDGVDLRRRFMFQSRLPRYKFTEDWLELPCSVLEFLVALSQKFAFQIDHSLRECFWHLLRNVGLSEIDDASYSVRDVDAILDRITFRTYDEYGQGGLFPLTQIDRDQRQVETLYQLYTYVNQEYYP